MTQKLLLIDENPQLLTMVGDYLSNLGYEVHRACEFDEAMALLRHCQYSLIITGVDQDGFCGQEYKLTQCIKGLPNQPRVVRMEAAHSTPSAAAVQDGDSTMVLEKPNSLLRLGALMQELSNA